LDGAPVKTEPRPTASHWPTSRAATPRFTRQNTCTFTPTQRRRPGLAAWASCLNRAADRFRVGLVEVVRAKQVSNRVCWGSALLESETPLRRAQNGVPDRLERAGYPTKITRCRPHASDAASPGGAQRRFTVFRDRVHLRARAGGPRSGPHHAPQGQDFPWALSRKALVA
jgi:hypothetical protein